jgi:large subunit ribosomal protein L17
MRHNKANNHLGRKAGHRRLMLANMAASLIKSKRITTTVAKAKALRKYVEPLITKSKSDTTTNRRTVFSYLQDKVAVTELFNVISGKISERPGGYTRIIKLGFRLGDSAETAMIELVDFNEIYVKEAKKATTRRSRRKATSTATESAPVVETPAAVDEVVETPVAVEETAAAVDEVVETPVAVEETTVAVEEVVETPVAVEETPTAVEEASTETSEVVSEDNTSTGDQSSEESSSDENSENKEG